MSDAPETEALEDLQLVESFYSNAVSNLSMLIDRDITVTSVTTERVTARVEGKGRIHISFKLGFKASEGMWYGCLLVPLPDAVALAGYLMMMPDEAVSVNRELEELDDPTKDAMLEVGNFIAGAVSDAARDWSSQGWAVRPEGCQGVRADVRPAFPYEEGSTLIVGRAQVRLHTFDEFEMIAMIPLLPGMA